MALVSWLDSQFTCPSCDQTYYYYHDSCYDEEFDDDICEHCYDELQAERREIAYAEQGDCQ
jgi:hypothetical protein